MKKSSQQEVAMNFLISKLIHNYMGLIEKDQNYKIVFDFIKNYLNNNSLVYSPGKSEIEGKIKSLLDKLEINSQNEKAKLLFDLICRLVTIFQAKNINQDNLFNVINIILQLAHSPIQTTIDIEMLRERFEDRYIRHESNKILKNTKVDSEDLQFTRTVEFDPVDYNELSSEYEYSQEEKEMENTKAVDNTLLIPKKIITKKEEMEVDQVEFDNKFKINDLNLLKHFKKTLPKDKLYPYLYNKNEWNKTLIKHLFKLNIRSKQENYNELTNIYLKLFYNNQNILNIVCNQNFRFMNYFRNENENLKSIVDSDYYLNKILINLSYFDDTTIADKDSFINKFRNFICLDISQELVECIINEMNSFIDCLNFLREIENVFERQEMKVYLIIQKLCSFIHEFIDINNQIVDSFIKLLNYQKGKIPNSTKNVILLKEDNETSFLNEIKKDFNTYINFDTKLTLLNFVSYYKNNVVKYVEVITKLVENIINIKTQLKRINKFTNSLFIKEVFDMMYSATRIKIGHASKKEALFYLDILFGMVESYLQITNEFIVNGNLLDINNEFFIDHIFTKKENQKIIFYFGEKFKKFDWIDSFKIKSFNFNGVDNACVPSIFMLDNLHFKILETSKSLFLIKNLKSNEKISFELFVNDNDEDVNMKIFRESYRKYFTEIFSKDKPVVENIIMANTEEEDNKNKKLFKLMYNENLEISNTFFRNENNDEKVKFKFYENYDDLNYIEEDVTGNKHKNSFTDEKNQNIINKYKSYFYNKKGEIGVINELEQMQNLISETENKLKKDDLNQTYNLNLDTILKKLIHCKILHINKIINIKLLRFLFEEENLIAHFNLVFNILLFKSGFSMNSFVSSLNDFLSKGLQNDNFFLKSIIDELSNNSDLINYKHLILPYVQVSFKENSGVYINNYHDFLTVDYQARLPLNIFFDKSIMKLYNSVFNFIIKIKKSNFIINSIE